MMSESPEKRFLIATCQYGRMVRGSRPILVRIQYADGSSTTIRVPPTCDSEPELDAEPVWPPAQGWGFRAGEYSYEGRAFRLRGKLWHLLRLLAARPGEAVEVDTIADTVWGGSAETEDRNIRNHVSMLRKSLIRDLGLEADPIEGGEGAYRLTLY